MPKATLTEFDKQAFLNALHSIPPDVIIEMAQDGIICDREVSHLLTLMGMQQHHIEAMRRHFPVIARSIMRYATRYLGVHQEKGICRLTGQQAVQIMKELLNRGLIDRYYDHVLAPSAPALTPDLLFARNKETRSFH